FVEAYFHNRGIVTPIVVEIGLMHNVQKGFYEELLNAEHIGIDINPNCAPDILGDSHEIGTRKKLQRLLHGREIDLLFIDANHSYKSVAREYELFAPLTKHIIVFHDIVATVNSEVSAFWAWVLKENEHMAMTFIKYNSTVSVEENKFIEMGLGLIIKDDS
ncbi:unnamed protein product, partial [marine sediment metagenome]